MTALLVQLSGWDLVIYFGSLFSASFAWGIWKDYKETR